MRDHRATDPGLPTLSVVVPNYNHARYLEGALWAQLDQSVPPLEIIVVDDASTDDSCAVAERLATTHPSVRLIRLTENGGVNAAMNLGLRGACGDYVCFSAADDLVAREFVAQSLDILAQHPAAAFAFSDLAIMIGESGVVRRLPLFLTNRPCMLSGEDLQRLMKRNYFTFPSHTILYRRDLLLELGGFPEELHWLADWFVNYVLAFRHGACYVPQVLAFYRVSPESYSARGSRRAAAQRDLMFRVLELLGSESLRDVSRRFRDGGVIPEFNPRVLFWLLASAPHRGYVTPRLVGRLLLRGLWSLLIPLVPDGLRRGTRWLASAPTRRRLAP